jgi:hypothetical protein
MFASIFSARKATGYKYELVLHYEPKINGESVAIQMYFQNKAAAKQAAKAANAKPYNYL